jgi:uncharacterized protein YndB with AHSA1/START domain
MKIYRFETAASVPAAKLFRAITAIARWAEWDPELEETAHDGALNPGARFTLKPKGGPKVAMEIVEASAPTRFVDVAHLPLAKMRTSHEFQETLGQTRVVVTIEVGGPLGFLWDRIVARKQAAGAREQTERFIAFARSLP